MMSNATQLYSHSGVALQILSRTALNITQTNSYTLIHCSEQVPCPVITAIQFTFTPHYKKINCSNSRKQNSKASTQTTKSRLHMQLIKFPFMPYNLLLELILISVFLFIQEKKEPTDDTSKDVYSLLAQHVSGIIMPIVRRQTE